MRLERLEFRRGYDKNSPMEGQATFADVNGGITLNLDDVAMAKILEICSAALVEECQKKTLQMKNAVDAALIHNRQTQIGKNLSDHFT